MCVYLYRVILLQQPLPDYIPFVLFYKMIMMFSIVILTLITLQEQTKLSIIISSSLIFYNNDWILSFS